MSCCCNHLFHKLFGDTNKTKPSYGLVIDRKESRDSRKKSAESRKKSQPKPFFEQIPTVSDKVAKNGIEEKIHNLHMINAELDSPQVVYWTPTKYEKELLLHTWLDELDFLYMLGSKIYIYIFEHCPSTKKLFPTIHAMGENYSESELFKGQALKFVQVVCHCIESLNEPQKMAEYLRYIGEKHVQYSYRGFKPLFWNIYLDALDVSLSEHIASFKDFDEKKKKDANEAWRKLAKYTITHMKRGYVRGLVKEFNEQSDTFSIWAGQHPGFQPIEEDD